MLDFTVWALIIGATVGVLFGNGGLGILAGAAVFFCGVIVHHSEL